MSSLHEILQQRGHWPPYARKSHASVGQITYETNTSD